MKRAQEAGNGPLFYRARKLPGEFTGASRNATSGPIKFPDNGPDKLSGPEVTGTFEKRAPGDEEAFADDGSSVGDRTVGESFRVRCPGLFNKQLILFLKS